MPTRLLREGILHSERINRLNTEEELFYRRLMSKVDDHGLFDARLSILRASLYPLRLETVTEDNCLQWLVGCINAKLVLLYQVDNKPFLKMLDTKWKARSEAKYPLPVHNCKQLKTPVTLDVVVDVVRSRLIEDVDVTHAQATHTARTTQDQTLEDNPTSKPRKKAYRIAQELAAKLKAPVIQP